MRWGCVESGVETVWQIYKLHGLYKYFLVKADMHHNNSMTMQMWHVDGDLRSQHWHHNASMACGWRFHYGMVLAWKKIPSIDYTCNIVRMTNPVLVFHQFLALHHRSHIVLSTQPHANKLTIWLVNDLRVTHHTNSIVHNLVSK